MYDSIYEIQVKNPAKVIKIGKVTAFGVVIIMRGKERAI